MRIIITWLMTGVGYGSLLASVSMAQLPTGWRAHDLTRPAPSVVDPGESPAPTNVPSDAVVLFAGKDLSNWRDANGNEAKWKVVDGAMESVAGSGYVFTKEKFGDCQLHVEWAAPAHVQGDGQGRGNSGVYLMGEYEIQVLDSFENKTYADGSAGAIYGQYPPLVNASRKPGQWQSYDIIFRRPRFDKSEKLIAPAMITVLHNGVLIQDHEKVLGPTNWIQHDRYHSGPDEESLSLQDHGNPVRYRNIWIRRLPSERPQPEHPYATATQPFELSANARDKLIGNYGEFSIETREGGLVLLFAGHSLELLPLSETRFEFRNCAGSVEFTTDEAGAIVEGILKLDAVGVRKAKKK